MVRIKFDDSSLTDLSNIFLLHFTRGLGVLDKLEVLGSGSSLVSVGVDSAPQMVDSAREVLGPCSASIKQGSSEVLVQLLLLVPSEGDSESASAAEGSL